MPGRCVQQCGLPANCTFDLAQLDGSGLGESRRLPDQTRSSPVSTDGVVNVEPPAATWDAVFTQYTHQFYEPFLQYIVSGVLSSKHRVAVLRGATFGTLSLADTAQFRSPINRDAIGYLWKTYSFRDILTTMEVMNSAIACTLISVVFIG